MIKFLLLSILIALTTSAKLRTDPITPSKNNITDDKMNPDKKDSHKLKDPIINKPEDPIATKPIEPSKEEKDPIVKHHSGDLPIPIEIEGDNDYITSIDMDHTPKPLPNMHNDTNDTTVQDEKYYIEVSANKTLVDGLGYYFYKFSNDKKDESTCYGPCTSRWHPVLADSDISDNIKKPLTKDHFSVLKRKDGKMQLCFHGIPLYYYEEDSTPKNPPKGMNADEFGGVFETVKDTDKN